MILIRMGKKQWVASGHAPKHICFCVSRLMDAIAIENGEDPTPDAGHSECSAPKGSLRRAAHLLFTALAMNYPKHVRLSGKP